jgi:hypothetical protein
VIGGQPHDLLNDARNNWLNVVIPLDADASVQNGWRRVTFGSPDLAAIANLEIHADTWGHGFVLWVDGARFDAPADFNDDGAFNAIDVDALVAAIAQGMHLPGFDLTGDGLVDRSDLDEWLDYTGQANLGIGRVYRPGDANLDGVVDGSDFGIWNANKFTAVAAWSRGDFSADGQVDGSDFGIWNANKFTSSDANHGVVTALPTPVGTPQFWPNVDRRALASGSASRADRIWAYIWAADDRRVLPGSTLGSRAI